MISVYDIYPTFMIVNSTAEITYEEFKPNLKVYIESFKIYGCVNIDLTKFNGTDFNYTCGNFATSYISTKFPTIFDKYSIDIEANDDISSFYLIINIYSFKK